MISVGIDFSKRKSTVCIMKSCGEILKPLFEFNHTATKLDSLVSLIKSYDEDIHIVLEYKGHYRLLVSTYLVLHDIFVCCVNALRMKKFCTQIIRHAKTGKFDSIKIVAFGITYWNELIEFLFSLVQSVCSCFYANFSIILYDYYWHLHSYLF